MGLLVVIACSAGADLAAIRLGDWAPAMRSESRLKQDICRLTFNGDASCKADTFAAASQIVSVRGRGCPLRRARQVFATIQDIGDRQTNRGERRVHFDPHD